MRISAVICVFDGERFLADAIASVRSQTNPAEELVVIDDGSTDRSAAIAESLGARCIRQHHAGIGAARNRGVTESRGDVIAFLDADDLWPAHKLERQAAALDGVDMVFGQVEQFGDRSSPPQVAALPGSALIRTSAFERVGPFETKWRVGEFVSWCARARELGLSSRTVDTLVLRRRIHGANQGIRHKDASKDYARILKAALDRRRAQP